MFAVALMSAAYAALLLLTGGFEADVVGIRFRSRTWERPALIAFVLCVAAITIAARQSRDRGAAAWARLDSAPVARALAALALAWALFVGLRYGTFAAGGADSFGYVSQAHLFARGALTDVIPMRPEFTWRDAVPSLVPLGYRPAAQPDRMAPAYPPGLPLLMSLLRPLGDRAIYAVVPALGLVVLLCAAAIGHRLGDPLAGGIAAACLSVSATFLLMHVSPMSDVPVTALWLGALLSAIATFRGAPAVAGVLAGVAVLTRPNLAPLALVVGALVITGRASRLRALASFATPLAVAVAVLLWIQWRRYGDPFMSGYGEASELFALAYIGANAVSYAARITAIYTPLIWLWLVSPVVSRRRAPRMLLAASLCFVAVVWLAYLPYRPFEAWFFTRFLLPAVPLMLVLAMMTALAAIRRLPSWLRPAVLLFLVVTLAGALARESRRRGVFEAAALEEKYPAAGHYVRDILPENAYVLARQHSGSIRLYSGRPTIRWDVVGGDQLDFVVSTVRAAGLAIYIVADQDEWPEFEKHFAGQTTPRLVKAVAQFGQARVYAVE